MAKDKAGRLRIEGNYAGVQASYWASVLSMSGFLTVFLSYKGFSDSRIGVTASLISVLTIAFQLVISNYSDNHLHIPIKRLVAGLYIVAMTLAALLWQLPMAVSMTMIVYAMACGFGNTIAGLLNAQIMQYINAGIPVRYGWPRGMGSIGYAIFAILYGALIERYSPALLMPLYLLTASVAMALVLWMPDLSRMGERPAPLIAHEKHQERTSYRQMLSDSPGLRLFLIASIILYIGMSPTTLFLVRVIQANGGGERELGIAMFIQAGIETPIMFLSPWLMRRYKAHSLLSFTFAAHLVKLLILTLAGGMGLVYAAMALSIFCFGVYGFASVYFVNGLVRPGEKVRAQGLVSLCGSLAGIISSMFAGFVIDNLGLKALLIFSSAVMLAALLLMLRCSRLVQQKGL